MKIAVGSENPVKLEAVENGFRKVFPKDNIEVIGVKVKSGVSEQPLSDAEMMKGAKNRAKAALKKVENADYGVGLEGGLNEYNGEWYGRSWMSIIDREGAHGMGSSVSCYIPPKMMRLVHEGKDLKKVCEELFGIKDIGRKEGYYGLLTNNAITRASGYGDGIVMALSNFIRPKIVR